MESINLKELVEYRESIIQAYLDEYCWRLENGQNHNYWEVFEATFRAIKNYFSSNNNDDLDHSIEEAAGEDGEIDFDDYDARNPLPPFPDYPPRSR